MLDDLKVLCRSHDWGYEYSDCYRTWDRGSRERAQIHDLITALTVLGLGDEARSIYDSKGR
jgi:hypothetical protein